MGKRKIKINAAQCRRCGDVIESTSIHDWVACSCFKKSKGATGIYVDGGHDYLRRGGEINNCIDLSEYEEVEG